MASKSEALQLLRDGLGDQDADFREGQWEAIDALVNRGERRLVVERTGWGKSVVYFISARILRDQGQGPTLIVSPLLALMRNQVDAAEGLGIRAVSITSDNRSQWPAAQQAILTGEADILLISPERLANDEFVEDVLLPLGQRVGLLVVDEAHCISDWGHDFRPDYRRISSVLARMRPNLPVLGTTATASNRVIQDVQEQLGNVQIQRGPLMRRSLALQTVVMPTPAARLAWLAEHINDLPGTGIIYTLTKRDARHVADWLNAQGVPVKAYYSGVTGDNGEDTASYREHLESQLLGNELKALVSTNALGMGYDKPDLGFVIHYQAPGSVVAYYQQVGRAGRAIDHAVGVVMSGTEDDDIHEFFRMNAFPNEGLVNRVLDVLANSDGMSLRELEPLVNMRYGALEHLLDFLSVESPSPVVKAGSKWQRTAVPYRLDRERIARLTQQRETEWHDLLGYINEKGCLMEYLARSLDDEYAESCGKCASCLGTPVVEPTFSHEVGVAAALFIRHAEFELECAKQIPAGAFSLYKFSSGNIPAASRAEEGRVLSRWRDAGWGQLVADGKRDGYFSDELVGAVTEMLRERWRPDPAPQWVTCVPSLKHPDLVPDYARRLAAALGLPFAPVVTKVHENRPQKEQENRFHQCSNLDGVFQVDGPLPAGPVLLVDDVVDSSWTLTVVSLLLKQLQIDCVWPLALASSMSGA